MTRQDWIEIIEQVNRTAQPAGLFVAGEWVEMPERDMVPVAPYRGGHAPRRIYNTAKRRREEAADD